jgi:uncharacterized protein YaaQ
MKLMLTIVQDADAGRLQQALSEEGHQSTKLASTGGFLREGNTTLIIGVDEAAVPRVMELIHETCRERNRIVAGSAFHAPEGSFTAYPVEVPVGGAIVFTLAVESFTRV